MANIINVSVIDYCERNVCDEISNRISRVVKTK